MMIFNNCLSMINRILSSIKITSRIRNININRDSVVPVSILISLIISNRINNRIRIRINNRIRIRKSRNMIIIIHSVSSLDSTNLKILINVINMIPICFLKWTIRICCYIIRWSSNRTNNWIPTITSITMW